MKRLISLLLSACLALACCAFVGCGKEPAPGPTPPIETPDEPDEPDEPDVPDVPDVPDPPALTYTNILKDPDREKGFGVKGQKDGLLTVYGYFRPNETATGITNWYVAQWYSGYYHRQNDLYTPEYDVLKGTKKTDGTKLSWTDETKTFGFDTATNEIYMELNAGREFTAPRVPDGPWPHLLIEYEVEQTRLSKIDGLQVSIDYRLDKVTDHMSEADYNPGVHAAMFPYYIVVKNCNENSKDAGKYFWFGIQLFDNRDTELIDDTWSVDTGSDDKLATNAFIFLLGSKNYLKEPMGAGKQASVQVDILGKIKKAFDLAVENGYFPNSQWKDMYVTNGNCGFELPGTFDIAATISKFEIKAGLAA